MYKTVLSVSDMDIELLEDADKDARIEFSKTMTNDEWNELAIRMLEDLYDSHTFENSLIENIEVIKRKRGVES